jgi:metal-sulfur cluster biosynthetic enzyme
MASEKEIYAALSTVYDTCSLFNGTQLDIVEMGLVEEVAVHGGAVRVRLLLTDPLCAYQFEMRAQIIEALSRLPGVENVEVEPVAGKLWWPERMAPEARERLETFRRERLKKLPLAAPGTGRA